MESCKIIWFVLRFWELVVLDFFGNESKSSVKIVRLIEYIFKYKYIFRFFNLVYIVWLLFFFYYIRRLGVYFFKGFWFGEYGVYWGLGYCIESRVDKVKVEKVIVNIW